MKKTLYVLADTSEEAEVLADRHARDEFEADCCAIEVGPHRVFNLEVLESYPYGDDDSDGPDLMTVGDVLTRIRADAEEQKALAAQGKLPLEEKK